MITCNKCGGNRKDSKAFRNIHNRKLSYLRGEKEFYTKILTCMKCEKCGHSWVN